MTIKKIAALAGVSPSTVSKIMNNKDIYINEETRQRVLNIIKEYNYRPYSNVKNNTNTFLIGIVLPSIIDPALQDEHNEFLSGFISAAQDLGYGTIVLHTNNTFESEKKCISSLILKNVCGILWKPLSPFLYDTNNPNSYTEYKNSILREIDQVSIPYLIIDETSDKNTIFPDYIKPATLLAQTAINNNHKNILCVTHDSSPRSVLFSTGLDCAFSDTKNYINTQTYSISEVLTNHKEIINTISCIICSCQFDALTIIRFLSIYNYTVPNEISVISLLDSENNTMTYPQISGISSRIINFGKIAANNIISMHEKGSKTLSENIEKMSYPTFKGETLDIPNNNRLKSILCVGSINKDCTIVSNHLPESGTSMIAASSSYSVGGKGANQAIGVARLGQKVILIGKVGNDSDSLYILDELRKNGVLTDAISHENSQETGKGYIQLDNTGESTITVVPGANLFLSPSYINSMEEYFSNASYCMITGEVPLETVIETCKLCKKHNVKTVLKPAATHCIPNDVYPLLDYFIPNSYEAYILSNIKDNSFEQSEYFRNQGAKCIIITMGANGCFVNNGSLVKHFSAYHRFSVIDKTGAADAFISTFTNYLSSNSDLETAVTAAQISAAYMVSQIGSAPAMIERKMLENYLFEFHTN